MTYFPALRTTRLSIQLKELSIGEAIDIAAIPSSDQELSITAFLRKSILSVQGVENPQAWTVQERTLAVCHYLAGVSSGNPDFEVGSSGHYSDYTIDIDIDPFLGSPVLAGEIGGDVWRVQPLLGSHAEAIERLCGDVEGVRSGRFHWLLGTMAAQLVLHGVDVPDPIQSALDYDKFLAKRMAIFNGYPEGDFIVLLSLYLSAAEKLQHLLHIDFDDDGLIVLPTGGTGSVLPPARFRVHSCLSTFAQSTVGKSH